MGSVYNYMYNLSQYSVVNNEISNVQTIAERKLHIGIL